MLCDLIVLQHPKGEGTHVAVQHHDWRAGMIRVHCERPNLVIFANAIANFHMELLERRFHT